LSFFTCYICSSEKPLDFVNSHHKVPKSLGGKDTPDNRVNLCSGCHQEMHAVARMMRNPKRVGEVKTALNMAFPGPQAQARCVELATLECKSKILNRAAVEADTEREIGVALKLKKPYRDALQLIARDRKLSMANYARKIMEEHIRSVYPNVEKS
jgi:hypothetical protein